MKTTLIAILALLSSFSSSFSFASEQYFCRGNYETEYSRTFFAKLTSHEKILEGQKMEMLVQIRDRGEVIFDGVVDVSNEDVQVFFRSRAGQPKLRGVLYLDELDQTSVNVAGDQMSFDCGQGQLN